MRSTMVAAPHGGAWYRFVSFFAVCALLAAASTAPGQKPGPADLFKTQLQQAAAQVAQGVGTRTVAVAQTRPGNDNEDALKEQADVMSRVTHGSLLMMGVRAIQFEDQRALEPTYSNHRLRRGTQFTLDDVAFLRDEKKADFLLQSRFHQSRDQFTLIWEMYDLSTRRLVGTIRFPSFRDEEVFTAAATWTFLPEANAGLLEFARENLGKQVGRGECWDLPATWLRANGYVVNGYDFGTEVTLAEALPGDVLTNDENGNHHVMLLWKPAANLAEARIYHQNTNGRRFVVEDDIPKKMLEGLKVWRPNVKK